MEVKIFLGQELKENYSSFLRVDLYRSNNIDDILTCSGLIDINEENKYKLVNKTIYMIEYFINKMLNHKK